MNYLLCKSNIFNYFSLPIDEFLFPLFMTLEIDLLKSMNPSIHGTPMIVGEWMILSFDRRVLMSLRLLERHKALIRRASVSF